MFYQLVRISIILLCLLYIHTLPLLPLAFSFGSLGLPTSKTMQQGKMKADETKSKLYQWFAEFFLEISLLFSCYFFIYFHQFSAYLVLICF